MNDKKSVRMNADEAWSFLAAAHTGILTTLRSDGFPVSLPVWFVVEDRTVLVAGPGHTKKFVRVRNDDRCSFLAETGDRWAELQAVQITGRARLMDSPDWEHVDSLLDAKYAGFRTPRSEMPAETREYYDNSRSLLAIEPEGRLLTWDNRKLF